MDVEEQLQRTWIERQELEELRNTLHDNATDILEKSDDSVKSNVSSSMKIVLHELHSMLNGLAKVS